MKRWIIASALLALALPALDAAAQSPSSAYSMQRARSAQACAELCAVDGLCIAWTFRAHDEASCALSAVAPMTPVAPGAMSGVSSRAPEFARTLPAGHIADAGTYGWDADGASRAGARQTSAAAGDEELLGGPEELPIRDRLAFETAVRR
jgi:hypothetical protein